MNIFKQATTTTKSKMRNIFFKNCGNAAFAK